MAAVRHLVFVFMRVCTTGTPVAGIVSKRQNVGSRKQRHVIGQKFLTTAIVDGRRPFPPEICAQASSDPPPFEHKQFRPTSAHSPHQP